MTKPPDELLQQALALHQKGELGQAQTLYSTILSQHPNHPEALHLFGVTFSQLGDYALAVSLMDRALELAPNHPNIWSNRARALMEAGQLPQALESTKRALAIDPNNIDFLKTAGSIFLQLHNYADAFRHFSRAIDINPRDSRARINRLNSLGELAKLQERLPDCEQSKSMIPVRPWFECERLHTATWLCDWHELQNLNSSIQRILLGEACFTPFIASTLFDDPHLLHTIAKSFALSDLEKPAPPIAPNSKGDKIRIAYYSSDFRNHPMAMLIPEVIESHDREKYITYLFSLTPTSEDIYRQRLRQACDHFIEVDQWSEKDITQKSRELKIDIAIDLMGSTVYNRHGIFSKRCAPIQAAWIGLPTTSGSQAIDYIIADPIVIPQRNFGYFTEKVVHLPCYFPNDSKRKIADFTPTKTSTGLPEDAFIFCSFNSVYKILPQTFYSWMRILAATPNSILWLSGINHEEAAKLHKEASSFGVDSQRIVFAPKLLLIDDHLARQRLADLFLDTFPYNAHTTAADALWAGLPLLTRTGQSFASRVAASLLSRIGLPELITDSQADFEARAIYLANEGRAELKATRTKLEVLRKTSPLFDGKAFAKDLEKAYQAMYDRSQAGLAPDFISVA